MLIIHNNQAYDVDLATGTVKVRIERRKRFTAEVIETWRTIIDERRIKKILKLAREAEAMGE